MYHKTCDINNQPITITTNQTVLHNIGSMMNILMCVLFDADIITDFFHFHTKHVKQHQQPIQILSLHITALTFSNYHTSPVIALFCLFIDLYLGVDMVCGSARVVQQLRSPEVHFRKIVKGRGFETCPFLGKFCVSLRGSLCH
jgi:hypothetical protein